MPDTYVLALDDSGTRHPDKKRGWRPAHDYDWFALGGILYREADEGCIRDRVAQFCEAWGIDVPLHSSKIRAKSENFAFVSRLDGHEQSRFYEELYCLMRDVPALGHGCVVDRPGYNARYSDIYGTRKWLLCKSAFSIVVERAAKYAALQGHKLRVYIEKSDKKTDRRMREYYETIRREGMPFSQKSSERYNPANTDVLSETLYEFRLKEKTSPIIQLADLYLWPICMGGYNSSCKPYARLKKDEKLIDANIQEQDKNLMIKYYCFDGPRETKNPA